MSWEDKVAKFGQPKVGKLYACVLEHYDTKKQIKTQLQAVDADDHTWEDLDGDEIDYWNWDIVSWEEIED